MSSRTNPRNILSALRDIKVEHRQALDRVQKRMRETKGVTAIIYDRTCAAEQRRWRKRGQMVDRRGDADQRLGLRGCGDCNEKSTAFPRAAGYDVRRKRTTSRLATKISPAPTDFARVS